jgi:hypothetical protein
MMRPCGTPRRYLGIDCVMRDFTIRKSPPSAQSRRLQTLRRYTARYLQDPLEPLVVYRREPLLRRPIVFLPLRTGILLNAFYIRWRGFRTVESFLYLLSQGLELPFSETLLTFEQSERIAPPSARMLFDDPACAYPPPAVVSRRTPRCRGSPEPFPGKERITTTVPATRESCRKNICIGYRKESQNLMYSHSPWNIFYFCSG